MGFINAIGMFLRDEFLVKSFFNVSTFAVSVLMKIIPVAPCLMAVSILLLTSVYA
ncbi:MAG: hypothetical protein WCJ33_06545 [Pseudomonadota bacterium]